MQWVMDALVVPLAHTNRPLEIQWICVQTAQLTNS